MGWCRSVVFSFMNPSVMNLSLPIRLLSLVHPEAVCVLQPENGRAEPTKVRRQGREGEEAGMKSDYKYSWQHCQLVTDCLSVY